MTHLNGNVCATLILIFVDPEVYNVVIGSPEVLFWGGFLLSQQLEFIFLAQNVYGYHSMQELIVDQISVFSGHSEPVVLVTHLCIVSHFS